MLSHFCEIGMVLRFSCNPHGGLVALNHRKHRHWCQSFRVRPPRRLAFSNLDYAGSSNGLDGTLPSVPTLLLEELEREASLVQQRFIPAVRFLTDAAAGVARTLLEPFNIFDAWFLNVVFLVAVGLLVYNLLVLAPRQ